MYKKIVILSVIILLGIGNVYFYYQGNKLDYAITIGMPVEGDDSTTGIDFNDPISNKDEADLLTFSFMSGVSIDKPEVCETLPKLTVWFNDWNKGMTHRQINLWIDEDTVIFETDINAEQPQYKVLEGSRAEDLISFIEKYSVAKRYK